MKFLFVSSQASRILVGNENLDVSSQGSKNVLLHMLTQHEENVIV